MGPAPGQRPGPERGRGQVGVPVQETVWACWPPAALCVSAPASAAPESLRGHGR